MTRRAALSIIAGMWLLFAAAGVFGQQAVIRELTGTVEVKQTGSSEWETAVRGQTIAVDTIISTGFKSSALIGIGNSVITVRPLTRLSITELSRREAETINVNLQAGRVRVDVKIQAGYGGSFSVQTPMTVASVRGTVFEIDTISILVTEGSVEYTGISGPLTVIDAVRYSHFDEKIERIAPPMETLFTSLRPDLPIGSVPSNSFNNGDSTQQKEYILGIGATISF